MSEDITGVEVDQVAADNDTTAEEQEFTPTLPPEEVPQVVTLEELFPEEATETVEETSDDGSQEQTQEEAGQQNPTGQKQTAGAMDPIAFSARLKQEKGKMDADWSQSLLGATKDEAAEIILEYKAQKLMEENPDMNMSLEFAKRQIKLEMKSQPAQASAKDDGQQLEAPKFDLAAWTRRTATEETILQQQLNDPTFNITDYKEKHPMFKAAILGGAYPLQAYKLAQAHENIVQQQAQELKAQGGKEVIEQIQRSNGNAMPPPPQSKGKGTTFDINNSTKEQRDFIDAQLKAGKKVYIPD